MSFIQKEDAVIINTKLTNIGRLLLASGRLTFSKIEVGDSEIDYNYIRQNSEDVSGTDYLILRPKDINPTIKSPIFINSLSNETKKDITNITPIEVNVLNTAKERGFYTGSTTSGFTAFTNSNYILGTTLVSTATGGTILNLVSTSSITTGNTILVDWVNPVISSNTFDNGVVYENIPRQFIWYKVLSVNGNDVVVDKQLPNFNGNADLKSRAYIFPTNNAVDNYYSTGTTVGYWNDNTLAFNSNCNIANDDVLIWNFNIVYTQTPAGVCNDYITKYYDSYVFQGFKEYILGGSSNSGLTQLGIIHYTNNSISNYYGEGFYNKTFKVNIPTIMYHGKTANTMGVTLIAYGDKKVLPTNLSGFTTEYYDLVEDSSLNIVGKVFNDLKLAIIEDQEILTTLSLKSNRSHTLPPANWVAVNSTPSEIGNNNSLLVSSSSKYLAITYLFSNDNSYNISIDLGFSTPMHCGYITKLYPSTLQQNVQFNFNQSDLKFMLDQVGLSSGIGFNANDFSILAQLVNIGDEPEPNLWKKIDYTTNLTNYGTWGTSTIDPIDLCNTIYRITYSDYTGGTTYDLSNYTTLPTPSNLSGLGFGEESILLGNVNADIKAVVYRTQITEILNFNEFNTSTNSTFMEDDDIYVSEVGIYDINNNLVSIGKLNNPVKKNNSILFTLEIDMDF